MSNRLLVILLSVLASRDVFAWSWKDAVSMAIDKNPNLQAQKQNAEVFELRYKNAKALMYPRLSIRGVMQEFQNETSEFQYRATIGPRLQWLLYQGGKVRAGIHQADAIQKQTDINVLLTSVSTNSKLRECNARRRAQQKHGQKRTGRFQRASSACAKAPRARRTSSISETRACVICVDVACPHRSMWAGLMVVARHEVKRIASSGRRGLFRRLYLALI